MKQSLTYLVTVMIAFFVFTGCQNEIEVTGPEPGTEGEPINATSGTASLIKQTARKDGSIDNIIDNASCLTVVFPVSVVVNGVEVTLNNTGDIDIVEALLDLEII